MRDNIRKNIVIMIVTLILFISLYLGANFYVFLRLWQLLPAGSFLRPVIVVAGAVLAFSIFLVFLLRGHLPVPLMSVFYKIGTAWLFILLYLFMMILVLELVSLTGLFDRTAVMRSNWITFGVLTGITALIMVAGSVNYHHKRRVTFKVDTSTVTGTKLESPIKIIAISDLHLGYTIGTRELHKWIETINSEQPHIIFIAGDLIDSDLRLLVKQDMASVLRQLHATYGVYIAPGNHEYIAGIDASLDFLAQTGYTVLRDSVVNVARLNILGRDDRTNKRRMPIGELTEGLDPQVPLIIVDHQPLSIGEAEAARAVLQVSGHTHRGQVWPFTWVTDRIYEDSHGLVRKGDTMVYVSSGLGIWGGKFRIGSVSEYVVIELI